MSVGKVTARSVGELPASAKDNHDNPVSGNHPGTVTLNTTDYAFDSHFRIFQSHLENQTFIVQVCNVHISRRSNSFLKC